MRRFTYRRGAKELYPTRDAHCACALPALRSKPVTIRRRRATRFSTTLALIAIALVVVGLAAVSRTLLARAAPAPAMTVTTLPDGSLQVSDGAGFSAVFDRAQEGGLARLYDLQTDPGQSVNVGPASGYTVFETYVNDGTGWANIGRGNADLLEVVRSGSGSVVVHGVGSFMHEDGSGPVAGLKHETWTTLYAGGRVSIQRQLKTGASTVNLANFGGKAIDVSTAAGWYGIYSGGPGDTSLGSGTNTWTGNGSEPWVGFRQAGSGPGQSLGVGLSSWQGPDFGIADSDLRLLVGNVSPRSHVAQRTEGAVSLAANSTYSSWFGGWLSANLTMAGLGAEAGDYRNPGLSLSTGSLAPSDSEPSQLTLSGGYNPASGSYVVNAAGGQLSGQFGFPAGVAVRYRPALKIQGWSAASPRVQLGSSLLVAGTDYLHDHDAPSGTLRLVFLKDIASGAPGSGQLAAGTLSIT